MTRWLDFLFNIWPFITMTICPTAKIVKVGSKFCEIPNKPLKNLPKTQLFFAQVAKFGQIRSHLTRKTWNLNRIYAFLIQIQLFKQKNIRSDRNWNGAFLRRRPIFHAAQIGAISNFFLLFLLATVYTFYGLKILHSSLF